MMILFDLFINHRRINLPQLIIILLLAMSVALTFIGDKIFTLFTQDELKINTLDEEEANVMHTPKFRTKTREESVGGDKKLSLFHKT
jgi:hypothetical protein